MQEPILTTFPVGNTASIPLMNSLIHPWTRLRLFNPSWSALAATEVGAVGLGTLVTILATTASADATGIILASVVALLGLFIIPARKRQAKVELRHKIATLREQLLHSLRTQFEKEMERGMANIKDAIGPYGRFVRSEQSKLEEVQSRLADIHTGLEALKIQVEEVIAAKV